MSLVFCFGRLLIIDSIHLIDVGLFRLFVSSCVSFVELCQEIGPFNLGYQICGHRIVYNIHLLSFYVHGLFSDIHLSFLILVICVFLFFLVSLEAYCFYWYFQTTNIFKAFGFADFLC